MMIRINHKNVSEKIYLFALGIACIANILFVESTLTDVMGINKSVFLAICENTYLILLLVRGFFFEKYTWSEAYISFFLLSIALISVILSGGSRLLFISVLFVVMSKNVNYDNVVKIVLFTNIAGVMLISSMALGGIIDINATSRLYNGTTSVMRVSLGFLQPNYLGGHLFVICLCLLYLFFYNISIGITVTIVLLDILIYVTCYSRTNFYLIILSIIFCYYIKTTSMITLNGHKKMNNILKTIPIWIALLSTAFCIFYNESILGTINSFLSNRLLYGKQYFSTYGFSILGQSISFSEVAVRSFTLDNAYMHLGIRFGIVWLLIIPLAYSKLCSKALKNNKLNVFFISIIISIWGMAETYYFRINYNFALIFLGTYIFKSNNEILFSNRIKEI